MKEFSYQSLDECFRTLKLDITSTELAAYAEAHDLDTQRLEAVNDVFTYLREKKIQTTIDTILKTSRLPLKDLKTFDNFDFSLLHGQDVEKLKALPSLSAIYLCFPFQASAMPSYKLNTGLRRIC